MIQNYFITAWRNILRRKVNSTINILGLSLGLACTFLIVLFVKDELTYDRFLSNTENIYHVISQSTFRGETKTDGNTGILQGPLFTKNVPDLENYVRIQGDGKTIKNGENVFDQEALSVDSSFFKIFSYPLLYGDRNTCLNDPLNVVISKNLALKLFGKADVVGKNILFKNDKKFEPHKISAVVKNVPANATIKFDMLLPIHINEADMANKQSWGNFWLNTFVVAKPHANVAQMEKRMNDFFQADSKAIFEEMKAKMGIKDDIITNYSLQPMQQLHLSENAPPQNGLSGGSKGSYSYILGGIALFILLIACINFINLSLAQSMKRAKEIGIRKVMGSERKQLIAQFMGESFLLCTIAFAIALFTVWLTLPFFNKLAGKEMAFGYLWDEHLVIAFICLLILTALVAGFYPALVLSGFTPVKTLYNRFSFSGKAGLQKTLVVVQFALASFLIVATLVLYKQFKFLSGYDLGMNNKNVLTINNYGIKSTDYNFFRNQLLQNPEIEDVTVTNGGYMGNAIKLPNDSSFQAELIRAGANYIPFFGLKLLSGRDFTQRTNADSVTPVVVNEAMVKKAGWKNAIGQKFRTGMDSISQEVIGVVKNYHSHSLSFMDNADIEPAVITLNPSMELADMHVRIRPGKNIETMSFIEKNFKKSFAGTPYRFSFREDAINQDYDNEKRWKNIMLTAAFITLFISAIGLFGMALLSAEKRTKEIGVRKVLGASVSELSMLLTRQFLWLIIIAMFIAFPVAYILGNKWLQHYAYRINISWTLFVIAAFITIFIAILTVGVQAIKAALANPVKSLRTE